MPGVREFLQGPKGQFVAGGFAVLAAATAAYSIFANVGSPVDEQNTRVFVDAETLKPFKVNLRGATIPALAPSGKKTGYPAELCYWTADGKTKTEPTPVLLNEYKGSNAPTYCPDCGRLVVGQNPVPGPTSKPPPTAAERKAR